MWQGPGVELLGLERDVTKEAFERVIDSQHPITGQRLTPRMNTTRREMVWKQNQQTKLWEQVEVEVENRRIGLDLTFSMPKSASVYYGLTKDKDVLQAFLDTNAQMVNWMMADLKVRVRVGGADYDRESGIGLCSTFLHTTARPVSGLSDPHIHCHNTLFNLAYDVQEQRWKAAQLSQVLSNEWRYRAKAEALFAHKLVALGHRLRKTTKGFEMNVITPEEIRTFSKRSEQIRQLEEKLGDDLQKRADIALRAAARQGKALDPETAYAAEKAKLAGEYRESKSRAKLEGEELEVDWRRQLEPGRLEQITPEISTQGASVGLVESEAAKRHAIKHVFENKSVAKESELIVELLKTGIGRVSPEEAEDFVKNDARLARSVAAPGKMTTREVYREELRILETVQEGHGRCEALGLEKPWNIRDQKILSDAGQLNAVFHILESKDMLTAVAGLPGTGKSTMIAETAEALQELTGASPVMLGVTASAVSTLREKELEANTFAYFKVNQTFQETVVGRTLWVDEASLVSNHDFQWILDFAYENRCRLILTGDPQQHEAVQRGQPFKLLIDRQVLKPVWLEEIYRQRNAPELKEIVKDLHAEDHQAAFAKMRDLGVYREFDHRTQGIEQLVEDVIAEKKAGKNPLVIAPVHRDGEAYAAILRCRMREEGMLGSQELQITRLNPLNLTEAQRQDWVNYEPDRIIEFHQACAGGFQSGQQWRVVHHDEQGVRVTRKGHEKILPLDKVNGFSVYETYTMPVAAGDVLLITKNSRYTKNGDLRRVKSCNEHEIVLDNGRKLDPSIALHVRQGHTVTSQVSQSKEREKMFALALSSGLSQINATQALVSVSRAQMEARIYTDSVELFEEAVTLETGHREAAIDFLETAEKALIRTMEPEATRPADLQPGVIRTREQKGRAVKHVPAHELHPPPPPQVIQRPSSERERGMSI